jgi:hypothetical protein
MVNKQDIEINCILDAKRYAFRDRQPKENWFDYIKRFEHYLERELKCKLIMSK